jgi:hypothetical protein
MASFFDVVVGGLLMVLTQHSDRVVMALLIPAGAHALTFLPPISRTRTSLQSSVLKTATTRRPVSSTGGQCVFFHALNRRRTSVLFSSSVQDRIDEDNDNASSNNATMVKSSYQRVAELDPEWFQQYVLSILGEDSILEELLMTTTTTTRVVAPAASLDSTTENQQQQPQQQEYTSTNENTASVSLLRSTSNNGAPSMLSVANSTSGESDKVEESVAERQSQLQRSGSRSGQPIAEKGEANQTLSTSSSAASIKAASKSRQPLIPQKEEEEEGMVERVRRIFDEGVEERLHPASSRDDDDDNADVAVTPLAPEEQVVVPVKEGIVVDEPSDEVLGLQVKTDFQKIEEETTASSENDYPDQKLCEPLSSRPPDASTALVNISAAVSSPTTEESKATEDTERTATQLPLSSKKRIIQEDDEIDHVILEDRVVLYKGGVSARPSWRRVPLVNLTALGYNEREIVSLQPDALDLIVSEGITKPRSGIPSRWKIIKPIIATTDAMGMTVQVASADSNYFVQIMSPSDADGFVKQQRAERSYQGEKDQQKAEDGESTRTTARRTTGPEGLGRDGEPRRGTRERERTWNGVEEQNRVNSSTSRDGDGRRLQRRRKRTPYTDDGRPKRVYSGRPDGPRAMPRRREDPPAPDSFLWPDVDTFRDLLRKEAGFRLAILGEDWSGVVKDESDWRLNLYTDWLWTLHNGWGSPIVESRSDRMRKSLNNRTSRPPPRAPPPQQQQRPARSSSYNDSDADNVDKRKPRPRPKLSRQAQEEEEED